MKQKLKKFKFILAITLAGILLFGCQVDEEILQQDIHDKQIKTTKVPLSDLLKQQMFIDVYTKIPIKKVQESNLNRTTLETQFGFTIVDVPVKVITKDLETHYNLLVRSDNKTDNKLENLVISTSPNELVTYNLIKYNAFEDITSESNVADLGISSVTDLELPNSNRFICFYAIIQTGYTCSARNTPDDCQGADGDNGCAIITSTTMICYDGNSGPRPFNTTTPIGINQGGSSGPINTPIISPVLPEITLEKEPCEILTPLLTIPKINTALTFLKTKTTGKSEFGYAVTNGWNAAGTSQGIDTEFTAGSNFNVDIRVGGAVAGGIHNHPINGGAYPSWGDIKWLLSCENNNFASNDGTAFSMIVVADPQNPGQTLTYSLTIAKLAALQTQINADMNLPAVLAIDDPKLKAKYFLDKQADEFKNVDNNTANSEKKFLEYFSNYGVNLSKLDPLTNKWNTLNLQNPYNPRRPNNPNTVIPTPCN